MYGISSSGKTREITPLLPWRPANLSPTETLRSWATWTWTRFKIPDSNLSPCSREKTLTPMTRPFLPWGTRKEESLTSRAFSPKMERSKRSSGVSSVSPFGVILPTKISFGSTSAPMRIMPSSSRLRSLDSPTLGISWVVISGPSLVSRTLTSNSSI